MFSKKLTTFLLTLSIVSSTFYLPVFAPRAQAIFGFGDLVIDIKALARTVSDGIARNLAQRMVDDMVRSTVQWAQTGFDGNPAYVTDPRQYITDIADGVAGEFIQGSDLGYLCSPFQTQIRLSVLRSYSQPYQFQCTLTEVVGNIEAFYDDFDQGGWDGWFSMTQNSHNNPYGSYLNAQSELDRRVASAVNIQNQQLDWNQGFLSVEECLGTEVTDVGTGEKSCVGATRVVTPGTTIKAQLDQILPSGLNRLIAVEHVEQLVGAFAAGLLNRYVFGDQGLFSGPSSASSNQPFISEPDLCDLTRTLPGGAGLDANCNPINPSASQFLPVPTAPTGTTGVPPGTLPPGQEGQAPETSPDEIPPPPTEWTPELQVMFDRYNELRDLRESRPGGNWTDSDVASGLSGEFASLLNPLGYARNAGLICTDVSLNRFVPLGTPGASCVTPGN